MAKNQHTTKEKKIKNPYEYVSLSKIGSRNEFRKIVFTKKWSPKMIFVDGNFFEKI